MSTLKMFLWNNKKNIKKKFGKTKSALSGAMWSVIFITKSGNDVLLIFFFFFLSRG